MKRLLVFLLLGLSIVANASQSSLAQRIDRVSASFIGKPYLIDPLGEGPAGHFDRDPRLRLDGFDCTTFVETVIAISKAKNPSEVPALMDAIRYDDGHVDFEWRNHFTDADWIPNNTRAGFVRDITASLAPSATSTAVAIIAKDDWYQKLDVKRLSGIPDSEKPARLIELHSLSQRHSKEIARIDYLRKEAIVSHPEILDRIPSGSVINIVRPNFDVTKDAGTHLNVTHQGFAIRKNGVLYFRHASPTPNPQTGLGQVTEIPLLEYVKTKVVPSTSAQGINVLAVL